MPAHRGMLLQGHLFPSQNICQGLLDAAAGASCILIHNDLAANLIIV